MMDELHSSRLVPLMAENANPSVIFPFQPIPESCRTSKPAESGIQVSSRTAIFYSRSLINQSGSIPVGLMKVRMGILVDRDKLIYRSGLFSMATGKMNQVGAASSH